MAQKWIKKLISIFMQPFLKGFFNVLYLLLDYARSEN